MNIEILEATDNPDELMCRAARSDYGADATASFEEIMETVDVPTTVPEYALTAYPTRPLDENKKMHALISKLFDRGHFGISEHPTATFCIQGVSRALMAQLTRHRHISFDIMSMRYVEVDEPDVYKFPEIDSAEPTGRNATFDEFYQEEPDEAIPEYRRDAFESAVETCYKEYEALLEMGVAPEHARMVLPIGTKVNIVMTCNVRTLLHVADMRAAADAQKEIRDMTEELLEIAEDWCPIGIGYYRENLKGRKNRLSP